MSLATAQSIALIGLDGHLVDVEADLAVGIPAFILIGLPDTTMHEARDRVRAAVVNSGRTWPQRRITLALSPASLPKRGSTYDLAIAVAVLVAAGDLTQASIDSTAFYAELSLDGRLRAVTGVLAAARTAARCGVRRLIVARENFTEACLADDLDVVGADSLSEVLDCLLGRGTPQQARTWPASTVVARPASTTHGRPDLADLAAHVPGRDCLEIAAAGGHTMLLVGPDGSGRSLLAERLPTLMPTLTDDEALEVSTLHSLAGVLPADDPLLTEPPFRAPHHSISLRALLGGGAGIARPGEITLAHRGVLFLDNAPEFGAGHLDALRQPLETGTITLARAGAIVRYPARFLLALGANPCPCAATGRAMSHCECPSRARQRYLARISGPIRDRLDVHIDLTSPPRAPRPVESSAEVRRRVLGARERMHARFHGTPWSVNADVPARELRRRWPLDSAALAPAHAAVDTGRLSLRGMDRAVRVAWTLADLAGRPQPDASDVRRALTLRKAADYEQ